MKKGLQIFSDEYLKQCKGMTPEQMRKFLEDYRQLVAQVTTKCQPISIKIEPSLLNAFKKKAQLEGIPYQTLKKDSCVSGCFLRPVSVREHG